MLYSNTSINFNKKRSITECFFVKKAKKHGQKQLPMFKYYILNLFYNIRFISINYPKIEAAILCKSLTVNSWLFIQ